ncbi:hypothetical protein K2173_017452 [Erythroxylum novogranatense]|uniref:Glycosyltransferase n=1 Tax=Erythroxylum novogranatense TaxID=1862640 RepID=A0AAV8TMH5_9ROSI|nr:hypothetical protein K2173_017452 [Erythroxylum novogranatense]
MVSRIGNNPKHIVALAFPFGTHASPLLGLIRSLSTEIPDATFSFFSTVQSNRNLFSESDDRITPYDVADGLPENYVPSDNPVVVIDLFLDIVPGNFKKAMNMAVQETGRPITCIISDAFYWFGADIAKELNVPWLPLWTAGPRSLLLHVETDLLRQTLGINGPEDKTIDVLPGFSTVRTRDLPEGLVSGPLESKLSLMLHKMGLALPSATAVIANSSEELDPTVVNAFESRFQKFLNVGPFLLTLSSSPASDPHGCLDWLDKQERKTVVYISFGSVIMPPPHEMAELAGVLETSGFPFLWSLRGNPEEKLPSGFLGRTKEKGKIVSWAPQREVLQHEATGAFVTHAGWNSILESIIGCVPMISRPFFGDQRLNTRTIETVWQIGVGIEGGMVNKDRTIEALKLVLLTEEGEKMRSKLSYLKKLATDAVKSNGSSAKNFKDLVQICNDKM